MNKIIIVIETNNAAFDPENNGELYEVSRILQEIIKKLNYGIIPKTLYDINGNCIGKIETE